MSESQRTQAHGPYRIVRNPDGPDKAYFAGHYENGQIRWVSSSKDGVPYPSAGLAAAVQRSLESDHAGNLRVIRITS
ncbi:hypothetical protein LUCX_261 [Xanthomonas phage vB_XciM_LucasX]|nr:hypothetical protein LUCX_261 [Xanthomonas phage vB_XciM_LucasX]